MMYIIMFLTMDREKLYNRINQRVDKMMEDGLLDECIKLKEIGYNFFYAVNARNRI